MKVALALAALVVLIGCHRSGASAQPDVVLITVDRLRWEELGPWQGRVPAPGLAALREQSAEFAGMIAPAPGGAPAALSVLTGEPPSGHGIRLAEEAPMDPRAQTLADRLGARGWATGAFLQTDQVTLFMRADRGFDAWDGPPLGFPAGIPAASQRRDLEETIASGLHWLLGLPRDEPGFLWLHLAEAASPAMSPAERARALAELDRMIAAVTASAATRGARRGVRPVIVTCNLSSHGPDHAEAARETFLLEAPALKVRALVAAPGLRPGRVPDLSGLDELSGLIECLATAAGRSRLLDLSRGAGEAREAIVAETALPMTCCDAEPLRVVVDAGGPRGTEDPAVAASLAADAGWPGGRGAAQARDVVPAYLALDAAWTEAQAHGLASSADLFRAAASQGALPSARSGLGLALLAAGRLAEARDEFLALRESALPGTLAWAQARLGLVRVAGAMGDASIAMPALEELLAASPGDLRALTHAADMARRTGDPEAALAALQRLLDADRDNPFALEELGGVLMEEDRPREAAEAFARALARRPAHPRLLLASAEALAASRAWWSAFERINEHVTLYGASIETHLLLARCWRDTGRDTASLDEIRRARAFDPQDPRPCSLLRGWAHDGSDEMAEFLAAGCMP